MLRRLLTAAGGATSFDAPLYTAYSMLYNGQTGSPAGNVRVGLATSTDGGLTWARYASNPVITVGAAGTWDDEQVHGVALIRDGAQYVCFYGGYDGTNYRIGRAVSTDLISWTKATGNPLINLGSAGQFDVDGCVGPVVRYDPVLSPPWQMWYSGTKAGIATAGYADSTDGLAWTKRGQVMNVGAPGEFDDESTGVGGVFKDGSTYRLLIHGTAGANDTHTGRGTCTDPAVAGTYTKLGVIAQFAGHITSLTDGLDYRSNGLRSIVRRGAGYVGYGTAFQPVTPTTLHEVSFRSTSTDLVTWTTPTGELLPLAGGTFDTISAENPSVVVS